MSGTTKEERKRAKPFFEQAEANKGLDVEVTLERKFTNFWVYLENLKEIQELELKSQKLKRENEKLSDIYPELLSAKGLGDRMFNTTIMDIKDEGSRIWIHAADKEKAYEELTHRHEARKKEKEKLAESKKKKQKISKEKEDKSKPS
jgi:hypothetical protein